jgi:hypothetical protein
LFEENHMAEIVREPYVFCIEGEHLRVFKDGVEIEGVHLSQVSCEEGRHYVVFAVLLMNASFSAEEWDALNGRSPAAVEEASVAVEAPATPTPLKRRRA